MDKIVKTNNNDITRAVQPTNKNDTVDWTRLGREEMKAQLLSKDSFSKQMPTSKSYFDLNHQAEMLKYHDNFNVFTPDNLLHCQRNIIDQTIRRVTKKQPQSSVKISENVRKKIREIEVEYDNTLISLEVYCNYFQTGLKITMLTHCQKPNNMDTIK